MRPAPGFCSRPPPVPMHLLSLALLLAGLCTGPIDARAVDDHSAVADLENKIVLDLPPGPGNPRNSEGSFFELRDGRLLLIYSRFVGDDSNDHAKARLCARYSSDAGESWSDDSIIVTPGEDEAMNVMSVSLLRLGNGDIGLFYLLRRSWHDMRMQLRRSSDEGRTWSAPVQCMPAAGYYVVNNDRVIRLASGRLAIPAAWHRKLSDANASSALDWRGLASFFLSDDDGRTWRESRGYCSLPVAHTKTGLQEPGVVEMPNGVLWGWARTDLGRQYEFFSWDEGESWSPPAPSRFTSPASPLAMKRIPGSNRMLAVWNPAPNYETRPLGPVGHDRTPLVGAIGQGTEAWGRAVVLEGADGVDAGYCYTGILFLKDTVLLAYCAGGEGDRGMLNRLRIRKMSLRLFQ